MTFPFHDPSPTSRSGSRYTRTPCDTWPSLLPHVGHLPQTRSMRLPRCETSRGGTGIGVRVGSDLTCSMPRPNSRLSLSAAHQFCRSRYSNAGIDSLSGNRSDAEPTKDNNRPSGNAPLSTLLLHHSSYLDHLTPVGHPERPDRIRAIDRILEHEKFQSVERDLAPMGTVEDIARAHPMSYVDQIHRLAPAEGTARVDADTTMSPRHLGSSASRRWRCMPCGRRGLDEKGQQRLFRVPPAGPPRGKRPSHGLLLFQQRCGCRALRAGKVRTGTGGHRRFRRSPRQRHAGHFLGRSHGNVLVLPTRCRSIRARGPPRRPEKPTRS